MTLKPDDLILTGTPKGISHVYPGDVMRMEIEGIGSLENPVVAEEEARAGVLGHTLSPTHVLNRGPGAVCSPADRVFGR
jgi:hypothetical protein